MMKNKFVILLHIALLLSLTSCLKNEFMINFELPKTANETYTFLYYASDSKKGWYVEGATMMTKGKGEQKGYTRNPTIVYVFWGSSVPELAFYVERGDNIIIRGDGPNPASWSVEGNEISEEWSKWRLANREALSQKDASRVNDAVAGFVKKNPANPLSTILLLEYYDRRADESGFIRLWKSLKDDALEERWMDLCGRSDMITHSPVGPSNMKEMEVHSFADGLDTLRFGRHPALLYFWRSSGDTRYVDIDSLKSISNSFPDSASRLLADICLEPDSTTWKMALRNDSLKGFVRVWCPRGEADENIKKLGVERTPYFIVFDKKGKAAYRGEDRTEAMAAFRRQKALK